VGNFLSRVIPAKAGIQFLALYFSLKVQSFHSPCGRAGNFRECKASAQLRCAGYFWHCPKVTKRLGATAVIRFASCESNCPALLGVAGLRRQYIHVLLRKRGDPSPRPCGPLSATPAMLGTANGALHPRIRASLHCVGQIVRVVAKSARAFALASAAGCRPNGAPCGAASVRRGKPAGWRAGGAPVRCQHTDVLSANRRNTLAQSEGMDARRPRHRGWPSSWLLLLGHTRRSNPLARRASGSFALE